MSAVRSRRSKHTAWSAAIVAILVATHLATPAWAWERLGHRVISRLAERHLSPGAPAGIAELLESGRIAGRRLDIGPTRSVESQVRGSRPFQNGPGHDQ
jgi:hypothetical protein